MHTKQQGQQPVQHTLANTPVLHRQQLYNISSSARPLTRLCLRPTPVWGPKYYVCGHPVKVVDSSPLVNRTKILSNSSSLVYALGAVDVLE
jgi:hypothetical protein